jgi:hypothetical protein
MGFWNAASTSYNLAAVASFFAYFFPTGPFNNITTFPPTACTPIIKYWDPTGGYSGSLLSVPYEGIYGLQISISSNDAISGTLFISAATSKAAATLTASPTTNVIFGRTTVSSTTDASLACYAYLQPSASSALYVTYAMSVTGGTLNPNNGNSVLQAFLLQRMS